MKFLSVVVASLVLLVGCSAGGDTSDSSSSTESSSLPAFPVGSDGSIITPSGFVFKSTFAICNKAKCEVDPETGMASCTCDVMTDEWTLSPIPKVSMEALTSATSLVSTFTTANIDGWKALPCTGGEWADCYGALCTQDANGVVTCDCPLATENPGDWVKYVADCDGASCTADVVSAAPVFPEGSTGFDDYVAAVVQAGDPAPAPPAPCAAPDPAASSTTALGELTASNC